MDEQPNRLRFEDYLERYGRLFYPIVGVSMLPLLHQDRDVVTVEPLRGRPVVPGDVLLYRRDGRYLLHRVIEVRERDYVILGDNCVTKEYGVTDRDVLGVMTGFVRNGREHSVEDPDYRAYTARMLRAPDRRIARKRAAQRLRRLASRAWHKLRGS